ncbi:hypothetical protein [Flavobacterium capsici]|uniref:Uncharacterized protein n=1 Tax=Flavobacterium capsici TaxID=3075618 RepID=A0AA96F4W0_9FLAO|nr:MULTISPECIES: hypothetical protein [unclassified Flavobacterium]WNM20191.1 hypothetical protein RN608_05800 [Flavobacterium sp. PMR2A8]WNM21581.1 hypothetical protein RN605_12970 [Flavobacterium sp. PMTSA4]
MRIRFCRLNFRQFTATALDTFCELILGGLYQNAATFPAPPHSQVEFVAAKSNFINAFVEYTKYGPSKLTEFMTTYNALIAMLNSLAIYVDSVALGDASKIVLSGFDPSKETPQPVAPLVQATSFTLKRTENTGEIVVNITPVSNFGVVHYGCVCVEGTDIVDLSIINGQLFFQGGTPPLRYDLNKSRRKVFSNLKIGVVYYFYVFVVNSVSVSPLSIPLKLMAA